jgi:rod shape-determining protein MreC
MAGDVNEGVGFFTGLVSIRGENLRLREEVSELNSQLVEMKKSEEENKALREQLGVSSEYERNLVMASIMGNPQDLTGSSFILDKGSIHGIEVGDNVIKENYLVGIVREVSDQRSLADFITSPSVVVAVLDIDSVQRTEGLAEGQYGSSIVMKRILPAEEIKIGDTIVTSGRDGVFAPGLIIGRVVEIVEVPTEPLKSAYIETIVGLDKLNKLFVLTN